MEIVEKDEGVVALVERVVKTHLDEKTKGLEEQFQELQKNLTQELEKHVGDVVESIFGKNSSMGDALGAGLNTALGSLISGRKLDARSIANAAASTFVPEIRSLFGETDAQKGEGLMSIISAAQRNL